MFKKFILIGFFAFSGVVTLHGAQEVGCICKDGSIQSPDCGICGTDAGRQEQTADGATCYCVTGISSLKSGEASCADACALNSGWTGDFE